MQAGPARSHPFHAARDNMDLDPRLRGGGAGAAPVQAGSLEDDDGSTSASESPSSQIHYQAGSTTDSPSGGQQPGNDQDAKKARACESCRGLKVRCEPDPNDGPCKRCKKAGRKCVVTAPTRKRQKKTDSRVSELEKKIDALTASLHARAAPHQSPQLDTRRQQDWGVDQPPNRMYGLGGPDWTHERGRESGQQKRKADFDDAGSEKRTPSLAAAAAGWPAYAKSTDGDIVERGLMTMELASQLFTRYTTNMVRHLPAVIFPENYTVMELRRTKPLLFLSIMAAASGENHGLQRVLQKELMQTFADKVIVTGEKSLELVQALNIAVIWYWPPEYFEELKFYQLVHIAAVMAIDIGLGRKSTSRKSGPPQWASGNPMLRKSPLPDPTSLEARRTWLTCYFLSSNTAMSLHRPNLIRWTSFMAESKDVLETSPDAAPTDKYFCHLVWSHHLGEEVGAQFSMDDPSTMVNITDARTQYALRALERDLERYVASVPMDLMKPTLKIGFNVLNLYMHEMALHVDPSNDHLRPPFNTDTLKDGLVKAEALSAAHINALSACLTSIDSIFDTFLAMDIPDIRCLPVFNFVRVAYAVVVLMKMFFSASAAGSDLGKVINRDNMRVQHYLDSLLDKFRATAAEDKCRPAAKFLVVLAMLRSWFVKQGRPETEQQQQQQQQPSTQPAPQPTQQAYNIPTANTPLQLLSEVATGHESRPANQPFQFSTSTSSSQRQTPQPFYDTTGTAAAQDMPIPPQTLADGSIAPLPPWVTQAMLADVNFDSLPAGLGLPSMDGIAEPWYNDMFTGLPDPNTFPF